MRPASRTGALLKRWRKWSARLGLATALLLLAVGGHSQPDDIRLDQVEAFGQRQRPPVLFPHLQHLDAGIECTACHHRYQGGNNIVDEAELEEGAPGIRCASCHGLTTGKRLSPELDLPERNLRQAYHALCIPCHRQVRRRGEQAAGPVTCGGCHPRQRQAQTAAAE